MDKKSDTYFTVQSRAYRVDLDQKTGSFSEWVNYFTCKTLKEAQEYISNGSRHAQYRILKTEVIE